MFFQSKLDKKKIWEINPLLFTSSYFDLRVLAKGIKFDL